MPAEAAGASAPVVGRRAAVLADPSLVGADVAAALSDATDAVVADLYAAAAGPDGAGTDAAHGVALVAVGGYGRRQLAPGSDLDLWLVHDGPPADRVAALAERLWYPLWDAKLKLGHAVRSRREALALAAADLDTATAALSLRLVAGDAALAADLAERAAAQWRKRSGRWLAELARRVASRQAAAGEVAFLLEPDVKDGRGGLRDIHALRWAEHARPVLLAGDAEALARAERSLLDVRVELHRSSGRPSDVLLLERQDDVAAALGDADADALMARVAAAARTVAWVADEAWPRVTSSLAGPLGRALRRDRALGPGLVLRDGEVHVDASGDPAADPTLVLRAAAAAAGARARIDRASLERLAATAPALDGPWPDGARTALVELLATGDAAIPVLEALDQRRLLERVLPEWGPVRSRPQRNALHRFTVDRHLLEAAAEAAELAGTVARPDLLLVATWLHDLGKGVPGDHTVAGMAIVADVAARMGFPGDDVAVLVDLVRHHLLLPDVATRRDLSDDDVVGGVADAVGSLEVLQLLAALTEADARATGPAAWSPWKAELMAELVEQVAHVLRGDDPGRAAARPFPDAEALELLAAGAGRSTTIVRGRGSVLTVVTPDRPGALARVAGALALARLPVVGADAVSNDRGVALSRFRVELPAAADDVDWDEVARQVERALDGRLALEARLAERARVERRSSAARLLSGPPSVRFDNAASASCTVVEVRAVDRAGVLYRLARALADLDLDIRVARVATLGAEVVDTFYVRTRDGGKVVDRDDLREVERAVLHQLAQT